MNLAKPYSVLIKHLDKPECFLEDELFRDYVENFQNRDLISARFELARHETAKGRRLSVLKSILLKRLRQAS